MFAKETELVDKLVLDLQERFDTQYIVRELRGGNNIADVVYTTNIDRSNIIFDNTSMHITILMKFTNEKKFVWMMLKFPMKR